MENVIHDDITHIPQPLRQHVARRRLELGLYQRLGTLWVPSETPPTDGELQNYDTRYPHRVVISNDNLSVCLDAGRTTITDEEFVAWGLDTVVTHVRFLVRSTGGIWYRPRDTRNQLTSCIPRQRMVSGALSQPQSKQLITCFYLMMVEGVVDDELRSAISLVLYRYMVERGYTSRRMGRYRQDALYIGNGSTFRPFKRLLQYAPERLPTQVFNKLCNRDGKLKNRGSKGTRSKYKTHNRYQPQRRLKRSREDEDAMLSTSVV